MAATSNNPGGRPGLSNCADTDNMPSNHTASETTSANISSASLCADLVNTIALKTPGLEEVIYTKEKSRPDIDLGTIRPSHVSENMNMNMNMSDGEHNLDEAATSALEAVVQMVHMDNCDTYVPSLYVPSSAYARKQAINPRPSSAQNKCTLKRQ
jgi:hypothetical protein